MKDLWGDLPDAMSLQSPDDILQAQAVLLCDKTGGKLVGVVEPIERESWGGRGYRRGRDFEFVFLIRAPLLNNYTYVICNISYGVSFYPVWIDADDLSDDVECSTMDVFAKTIGTILRGERVRGVIATLLKQTNSRAAALHPMNASRPDDDIPF